MTDPAFQDTSGSAPHFMLATGGNDNLVKLWDVFTASGINTIHVLHWFCHDIDTKEKINGTSKQCRLFDDWVFL